LANDRLVYVLDATPIIYFAKIGKLELVFGICEAHMTKEVYRETVERGQTRPDATRIHEALERVKICVYDVQDRNAVKGLERHSEIHMGGS